MSKSRELQYLTLGETLKDRFINGEIAVNYNAHNRMPDEAVFLDNIATGEYERKTIPERIFSTHRWMMLGLEVSRNLPPSLLNDGLVAEILDNWLDKKQTKNINVPGFVACHMCGESLLMWFDGKTVTFSSATSDSCLLGSSDLIYTTNICVDSGKLIFGNDFRSLCREVEEEDHYEIEIFIQMRDLVKAYGNCNMFHTYVGNSCPGIFQHENGIITIAGIYYEDQAELEVIEQQYGKRLGSICTDLWWFSAIDEHELIRRKLRRGGHISDIEVTAEVEPGQYEMTVYGGVDHDSDKPVYATIKQMEKDT